jgi:hypothetical protein
LTGLYAVKIILLSHKQVIFVKLIETKVKIKEIVSLTNAKIAAGNISDEKSVQKAFSSDLMSDVLTLDEEHVLLITGLANIQNFRIDMLRTKQII